MGLELWIVITVAAAFVQNVRNVLQKRLTGRLSINGASYVRFCYALPFVWLYLGALAATRSLPELGAAFWQYALAGAIGQIVATSTLVAAYAHGNFAVGTAFSKTEVVQAAVFGLLVLGDPVSWTLALGIAVSLAGVWLLSLPGGLGGLLSNRAGAGAALAYGLASGACFAAAFVCYRGAALALPEGDYLLRAAITLAAAVSLQTLLMGAYLAGFERGELARVAAAWRPGLAVGAAGAIASTGWFTAATLQSAAMVRGLGQVELIFALIASAWLFREPVSIREIVGVTLIGLGVWILV